MRRSGAAVLLAAGALAACGTGTTSEPATSPPAVAVPDRPPSAAAPPPAAPPATPREPRKIFGGTIQAGTPHHAVRTDAEYDALVERLPKHLVRKGPREPSPDPLVARPSIDFSRHMLLVVTCPRFYCGVDVGPVRREGDVLVVTVERQPEPGGAEMRQRPIDESGGDSIGHYVAQLVARHDGEVRFEEHWIDE